MKGDSYVYFIFNLFKFNNILLGFKLPKLTVPISMWSSKPFLRDVINLVMANYM